MINTAKDSIYWPVKKVTNPVEKKINELSKKLEYKFRFFDEKYFIHKKNDDTV